MDINQLKDAGLTKNEILVYKAILDLGPSLAGQISRRSGLHRRTVYDVTEMLIQKGLIGYIIENNRRIFSPSNPERILNLIKEKENSIQEILPEMMNLFNKTQEKEGTNFYKGKNGLKSVLEDQLEKGTKEILILGAQSKAVNVIPFYFKWFNEKRIKNKIKMKLIYHEKTKTKISNSEIRYLPKKINSELAINIYRDKVAIILWNKEKPFAIVIKNKDITEGYLEYFEIMWSLSKKIK